MSWLGCTVVDFFVGLSDGTQYRAYPSSIFAVRIFSLFTYVLCIRAKIK